MEANRLMINDWVQNGQERVQVREILYDGINGERDGQELYNATSYQGISGISLTEEILKANGWNNYYCSLDSEPYFLHPKCHFVLQYHFGGIYVSIQHSFFAKITYVHELQHALRLCGLEELANNFKIE